jgi:hypothetical protein
MPWYDFYANTNAMDLINILLICLKSINHSDDSQIGGREVSLELGIRPDAWELCRVDCLLVPWRESNTFCMNIEGCGSIRI